MKVHFSEYVLTPLRQANRLEALDPKSGVLLKAELKGEVMFADYFAHVSLGDRPVEQFLAEFKFQEQEYDRKVFDLLLKDRQFQRTVPRKFYNHQLWAGAEELQAGTVKYKMMDAQDRGFLAALKRGVRVRLDMNGLFTRLEFEAFLREIPREYLGLFDYFEDPLSEIDWGNLSVPTARDFIAGSAYDYYIYKPNCEFLPRTEAKIIFSSYLGSEFGRWHAYCELMESGDLRSIHGIRTQGFYQEETSLFVGTYESGFIAESELVKKLYHLVSGQNWKTLCSM